ncbi:MAG: hypothetical protein KDF57_15825, partial [Ottowia sp.]|nr:hypothetical protein [Ottowia sp.]
MSVCKCAGGRRALKGRYYGAAHRLSWDKPVDNRCSAGASVGTKLCTGGAQEKSRVGCHAAFSGVPER